MIIGGVFRETFKGINTVPDILYPSINSELFDRLRGHSIPPELEIPDSRHLFLSINRFEPKKNLGLVIRAMSESLKIISDYDLSNFILPLSLLEKLKSCLEDTEWENVHLVVAGGYDVRLPESVEYLEELKQLVSKESLERKVTFVLSPTDMVKVSLLSRCTALVYTPSNEHFGIVPLEVSS